MKRLIKLVAFCFIATVVNPAYVMSSDKKVKKPIGVLSFKPEQMIGYIGKAVNQFKILSREGPRFWGTCAADKEKNS